MVRRGGQFVDVSWIEAWSRVRKIARGLVAHGLQPGDRVCIHMATSLDWILIDLAIMCAGGVTVAIYPTATTDECRYICEHSGATIAFVDEADHVSKFTSQTSVIAKLPNTEGADLDLPELIRAGPDDDAVLEAPMGSLGPDSILTIIYTSGTTARPRGVVLTHANMLYVGDAIEEIDVVRASDVQLLFLPLAHVFARVLEIAWLSVGHVMAFGTWATLAEDVKQTRPTVMCGVPRLFEKMYEKSLRAARTDANAIVRRVVEEAMVASEAHGRAEYENRKLGLRRTLKYEALRTTVLTQMGEDLMERLGGRMRLMCSGGAPLPKRVAWFFRDCGLTLVEGYGLTETSAATCINLAHSNNIGSVGPPVPGTEVRIADDGEILVRGPGVMQGYWKDDEATAAVLVDGWLHTGDIGEIDPRSRSVRITDRKKHMIVTAGGINVTPRVIERKLVTHPLVSFGVAHGDRRKYVSALLTLDPHALRQFARDEGLQGGDAALARHPRVRETLQEHVDRVNESLAPHERVQRFDVVEREFSIESGELTPKRSVKRRVIERRYADVLDAMYEERY
jgi:long-chain acyl-CoA synthetase